MSDFDILIKIRDILKDDVRTKDYNIVIQERQKIPEECPAINLNLRDKTINLARTGNNPYTVNPAFIIDCWEISLDSQENAIELVVNLKDKVVEVLKDNVSLENTVLSSRIDRVSYEAFYDNSFYALASVVFITELKE